MFSTERLSSAAGLQPAQPTVGLYWSSVCALFHLDSVGLSVTRLGTHDLCANTQQLWNTFLKF